MVNAISGAENGDSYWLESQHYWKVSSYTVENLDPKNQKMFTIGQLPTPHFVYNARGYKAGD